jgi:hypothetical protein
LAVSGCPARPPTTPLPPRQPHARPFTLPLADPRWQPPMAVGHVCRPRPRRPPHPPSLVALTLSAGRARHHNASETRLRTKPLTRRRCTPAPSRRVTSPRGCWQTPRRVSPFCPAARRALASKPRHRLSELQRRRPARPTIAAALLPRRCTDRVHGAPARPL